MPSPTSLLRTWSRWPSYRYVPFLPSATFHVAMLTLRVYRRLPLLQERVFTFRDNLTLGIPRS